MTPTSLTKGERKVTGYDVFTLEELLVAYKIGKISLDEIRLLISHGNYKLIGYMKNK